MSRNYSDLPRKPTHTQTHTHTVGDHVQKLGERTRGVAADVVELLNKLLSALLRDLQREGETDAERDRGGGGGISMCLHLCAGRYNGGCEM